MAHIDEAPMLLPIRTTLEDIREICSYLASKPTGVTVIEARKVVDEKRLDGRKLAALRFWGLLADGDEERLLLTDLGRELARGDAWRRTALTSVARNVPAYRTVIERAQLKGESSITTMDVAAYWHEHFRDQASSNDVVLGHQAVCFFHILTGAELGKIVQGRKGNVTRIEFDPPALRSFTTGALATTPPKRTNSLAAPRPASPTQTTNRLRHDDRPVDNGPGNEPASGTAVQDRAAPADSTYLQRGATIDCYTLERRLGAGFSAEVWSAHVTRVPPGVDLEAGQPVAIKFYSANALAIPSQVIRVEREYRVAQRLKHPHLIRIYEFMLASPRPNHSFLVMDIAPGPTLSVAINKHSKLEPSQTLRILAQLLSAAEALHEAGALHRDIKPGNIALQSDDDGDPKCVLLDLGIVSPLFEKSMTAVSSFVGSKHWAPLEQLVGGNLDERSDLYSIGAVAYNLLVGVEPFSGSSTEAAVAVEMSQSGLKIPPLATVPAEITELFNACLSNKIGERPRTARECLSVLKTHGINP